MSTRFQYTFDGAWYEYFSHPFNCGDSSSNRTERTVELSLADYWLNHVSDVYEVGAVTPYYWPNRVKAVIDPADSHGAVTSRTSLFENDFTGKNVLSISTVEHVGTGQYGISESKNSIDAIIKLLNESNQCLITAPLGWNTILDKYLLDGEYEQTGYTFRFMIRQSDDTWVPAERKNAYIRYGGGGNLSPWANSLVFIEKGNILH